MAEVQQRTAEQLFKTLGELKGGAMKLGQALSILESALPEELAAPYRKHLTKLQDSAPPMPAAMVHEVIAKELGVGWREQLAEFDDRPAAAASIGQVHRGRWHDGRDVAIKVQYPGAGEALMSDLKQMGRLARGFGGLFPGVDMKALVDEMQDRVAEELDYALEADAQAKYAALYAGDPTYVVPDVVAQHRQAARHRVDGQQRVARLPDHRRHAGGAQPLRRALRALDLRVADEDRDAARGPAPRQLPDRAQRRRSSGRSACWTSVRSHGCPRASSPTTSAACSASR